MRTPTLDIDSEGDETLMEDLALQRPEALQLLYKRYGAILRSVVVRVVHDEADADEVLQDTFCQIWNRADNYSASKGKPLGWLITLARRRAIDRLRQRGAYRRATTRFELENQHPMRSADSDHTVECEAYREEIRVLLERLMSRLPPAQQQVLKMAYFDGLSQREIAASTRLPLGTVKTRLELGLKKLAGVVVATKDKIR